jgi:hypothetical protein
MSKVSEYLTAHPGIKGERVRAVLDKRYNFASVGVATMGERIADMASAPGAHLVFQCGTSKKVNGWRSATKPTWSLLTDDHGFDVGEIGAAFARWLGVPVRIRGVDTMHEDAIRVHMDNEIRQWEKDKAEREREKRYY